VETRLFHEAWWGRAEPIHVSAFVRQAGGKLGQIRNVRFENIEARSENGVYLSGCDGSRPEEIAFDRVRIRIDKWTDWPGGQHDRRPCVMEGLVPHPTAGFYCAQAESVSLRNCRVCWAGRSRMTGRRWMWPPSAGSRSRVSEGTPADNRCEKPAREAKIGRPAPSNGA
jgi:hypothetical protein